MEVVNASKHFVSIETAQNEVIDTEQFLPEIGQRKLLVSYYSGDAAAKLEFSADKDNGPWIETSESPDGFYTNTLVYPRYVRSTGTGTTTIHFVVA